MDIQNHDSHQPRHAYHTADYQVSKREMAALWQRYYLWKAAKEKALQHPDSSVTTIGKATANSRRAYQTASVDTFLQPAYRPRVRTSRHAYHHRSFVQPKRLEASGNVVHITVS